MEQNNFDWAKFLQAAPAVVTVLRTLTKAIADSGLEKTLLELTKVRASQLNGCAFCVAFHLDLARKAGVTQGALDLVATWREAGVFTPREMAALAWTEALTLMAHRHPPDEAYEALCSHFSQQEIAFLTSSIAHINAWNRIAGGLRFPPGAVT
jgi:AhpD family alkylhydroperoxidase